jgi:hypothetical protein
MENVFCAMPVAELASTEYEHNVPRFFRSDVLNQKQTDIAWRSSQRVNSTNWLMEADGKTRSKLVVRTSEK